MAGVYSFGRARSHPSSHPRSGSGGGDVLGPEWWAAVVARSSRWSCDGSAAHDFDPLSDLHAESSHPETPEGLDRDDLKPHADRPDGPESADINRGDRDDPGDRGGRGDQESAGGRASWASWALVGCVREAAEALAVAGVPESAAVCAAEVEELVVARDRLVSAIAGRVGRVHAAGEARSRGHPPPRRGCGRGAG